MATGVGRWRIEHERTMDEYKKFTLKELTVNSTTVYYKMFRTSVIYGGFFDGEWYCVFTTKFHAQEWMKNVRRTDPRAAT